MSAAAVCHVVGVLDDGPEALSPQAREVVAAADLLIGGRRLLAACRPLAPAAEAWDLTGATAQVPDRVQEALTAGRRVAVLASGDPLCHGIGERLVAALGAERCRIHPQPSLVQLACARWGWPVAEVGIASAHGREAPAWSTASATPDHPVNAVWRALYGARRVAVYTAPGVGADALARQLAAVGLSDAELSVGVAARLGRPDEALFGPMGLDEAGRGDFPHPHVALLERAPGALEAAFDPPDETLAQRSPERGLITKREARAVTLGQLALTPTSRVWDIGAGSGAVALDAARLCPWGHVWAIERSAEDWAVAESNRLQRRAANVTLRQGEAPRDLADWPDPDAVFIGGSGGALAELIDHALARLRVGGRLVINLATVERLEQARARLDAAAERGVASWQLLQLQAHRSRPLAGLRTLRPENPVWIVSATREAG